LQEFKFQFYHCPLKLIFEELILLCEVEIFPKMFVPIIELGFKGSYLHYFVVLEQIVAHMVDLVLAFISAIPLLHELAIVVPFWAIFGAPSHLISSLDLKRFVVLY